MIWSNVYAMTIMSLKNIWLNQESMFSLELHLKLKINNSSYVHHIFKQGTNVQVIHKAKTISLHCYFTFFITFNQSILQTKLHTLIMAHHLSKTIPQDQIISLIISQ
jgi:hypothetical protein